MLKNAYLLAKIGADTAEIEQHFAQILPIGSRVAEGRGAAGRRRRLLLLRARFTCAAACLLEPCVVLEQLCKKLRGATIMAS